MADWEDHFCALHYKDLDIPSVTESYMHMQHEHFDMPICQYKVMSVVSNRRVEHPLELMICHLKFLKVLIFLPAIC